MIELARNEFRPDYAIPPGEILNHELQLRGMRQRELAKRTGLTPKHIVALIKGHASITPETAIKLERAIGMPAQYWLNLEAQYQETRARLGEEKQLNKDQAWLKRIPVKHMAQLGWIKSHNDKRQQLEEILKFFGIASIDQWEDIWPELDVAFRQHNKQSVHPEAISAWLRQGELEAARMECKPYDREVFRDVLEKARLLTGTPPEAFIPALQENCSEAGVAVVFIPLLPKTGLSGATRWLNADKALIQLSMRYKSNDQLWFTFFHEAGHILLHNKKELFLEDSGSLDEGKERKANIFAQNELIPKKAFNVFVKQGRFDAQSVIDFAKAVKIAPGIVVGRLQYEGILQFNQGNALKLYYEDQ